MARTINPSLASLERLRSPLTSGEARVLSWLDGNLHPTWEIYIRPHLNGLYPDFVLLHPRAGVVVIEVKDWSLASSRYRTSKTESGVPRLEILTDSGWKSKESDNPVAQLAVYRDEIQNLYCPHLDGAHAHRLISCAAIMTVASRQVATTLLRPSLDHFFPTNDEYPMNCALLGAEDLDATDFGDALRAAIKTHESGMSDDIAEDLRHWLIEPEYSAEQREPIALDPEQRRLASERTQTGYRRIKGPAGSGKSQVLAARAATLLGEGKEVLVVSFNLTLLNYLQDLAVRWPLPPSLHARKHIVWLNFHSWCRRLCWLAGETEAYRKLWAEHFKRIEESSNDPDRAVSTLNELLNDRIAELLNEVIRRHPEVVQRFDAILIDEGQDFRPSWIKVLRQCVRPDGEFLLVADKSQDIYGTARLLTEEAMTGCGFSGRWAELRVSYRMPAKLTHLLSEFAQRFLPSETRDLPAPEPQVNFDSLIESCSLRWVQAPGATIFQTTILEIERLAQLRDNEELPIPDITVLVSNQRFGLKIADELEKKGIHVLHTFNPDDSQDSRRRKVGFYKGVAKVKATTIHSFKGLEARALVICLDALPQHAMKPDNLALFYTAMSRLKRTERGAHLTVVCGISELADYARRWTE